LIQIIDQGIGIKKKYLDKLFQPFSSIRDKKRKINMNGIGLGLVICKLIVSKFNGHINFISKYGKGTTFYFTFEVESSS
jgi:signal transduction histidine kinase